MGTKHDPDDVTRGQSSSSSLPPPVSRLETMSGREPVICGRVLGRIQLRPRVRSPTWL